MMLCTSRSDFLTIYLNDHLAGAGAGVALAKRIRRNNQNTPWSQDLAWLVSQIESDESTLVDLRASLGVSGGRVKRALAIGQFCVLEGHIWPHIP